MNPVILNASDFVTRDSLDTYVRNNLGDDINANRTAGHAITGSADDLKRLNLSTDSRVYGVKVQLQN